MQSVQEKMLREMHDKKLFDLAHNHTYSYLNNAFERNIFPSEDALQGLKRFDEALPHDTVDAAEVIDQLHEVGAPATVAKLGGRYFGFVIGSALPVGLAAKHMATYWDQIGALHVTSPINAKLESVVESWLKQLLGLPENAVAGYVTGTSAATFCGLAAARFKLLQMAGWDVNEKGLNNAPKIRIVTGKHSHSTVLKAIAMLGFGKSNIEFVDVDEEGRVIAEKMPPLDNRTILILQAGNVNSGSFDPFEEICIKAKAAGAWVHIDGAFGLWAAAVEKLKYLTKGIEHADSWSVDGHKTLNTPYDCGIVLCADKEAIVSALHMTGSYIIQSKERDGMYYTPDMSQRARAIELWACLRYLGKKGVDDMIYTMHQRAVQFAEELKKIKGFRIVNDVVFNQVLVQCETNEITDKTLAKVQELRVCWAGGAEWFGKRVIRVSICSWATTETDITQSVHSFAQALSLVTN
ncbi:MAG: aspartate aminotransferase family protein [Sediminibacterium sp.]|nr:aspartate aminotransferase family protein [Sediminibacterium sp.]